MTAEVASEERKISAARRTAVGVFGVRVVSAGLVFLLQIVLARWLGVADYGHYVALWAAVLVAGGLSHLGLSVAMMRLVPEYAAKKDFAHLRGILFGGRLLAASLGLAVALLGGLALYLLSDRFDPELTGAIVLALACLPMYALCDVQDALGRGQSWTFEAIVPPYIVRPLLILGAVGVAFLAGYSASVPMAMAAALLALWISGLAQTLLIERRVSAEVPEARPEYAFRYWLAIALPLLAVTGAELVLQNADVLLLNLLGSPTEAGLYYAAAKTASLAFFVHYAVGSAYAGRITAAGALADHHELKRVVREAVVMTFWPTFALLVAILALGLPILMLFGTDFGAAYPYMFIVAIGVLGRAAMGPSEVVLNMLDQHRACAKSYVSAAAVSIALNVLLIPKFGAYGASIATATAFTTAAVLNWRAARNKLGLELFVFGGALHGVLNPGADAGE